MDIQIGDRTGIVPDTSLRINEFGGPLVMMSATDANHWDPELHYDSACSVDDYAGLIEFDAQSHRKAIVFGEQPMESGWEYTNGKIVGYLWRWLYAPRGYKFPNPIELNEDHLISEIEFDLSGTRFLIFEAATDAELEFGRGEEVEFKEAPSRVKTFSCRPHQDVFFIIHCFLRD